MPEGWKESLDLATQERLERFKDTPEGMQNFADNHHQLDRSCKTRGKAPDSVDGYAIPETVTDSSMRGMLESVREDAREAGISPSQWEKLSGRLATLERGDMDGATAKMKELNDSYLGKLKEKFGDQHETMAAKAHRVVNRLIPADDPLRKLLDFSPLGSHPALVEFFSNMEDSMGDDKMGDSLDDSRTTGASMTELIEVAREGVAFNRKAADGMLPASERKVFREKYFECLRKVVDAGYEGVTDPRLSPDPEREMREQSEKDRIDRALRA